MKLEYQYEKAGSTTAKDQGDGIAVVKHIYFQLKILKIQVRQNSQLSRRGLISDNDISGGSFGIRQVKLTLNGAFSMLQEALCQRARTMVGDKEWYRAGDDDPEELTILGKVMGVTREVSLISPQRASTDESDIETSSRTPSIAS